MSRSIFSISKEANPSSMPGNNVPTGSDESVVRLNTNCYGLGVDRTTGRQYYSVREGISVDDYWSADDKTSYGYQDHGSQLSEQITINIALRGRSLDDLREDELDYELNNIAACFQDDFTSANTVIEKAELMGFNFANNFVYKLR